MEGKEQSFIQKLDNIAGQILPYVEAAAAFKRGYQGGGQMRQANDRFQGMLFEQLEKSRQRNEQAIRDAKAEREERSQRRRVDRAVDAAFERGDITSQQRLDYALTGKLPTISAPEVDLGGLVGDEGTEKMLGANAVLRGLKEGFTLQQLQQAAEKEGYEFGQKAEDTYF